MSLLKLQTSVQNYLHILMKKIRKILQSSDRWHKNGSGWVLESVEGLTLHTIVSALQCGGNRRLEMKTRKNSFDLPSVFTESLLLANILDWCWNME